MPSRYEAMTDSGDGVMAGCSNCAPLLAQQEAINAALREEFARLRAEVLALKERLEQDPSNSNRPPSSQAPPATREAPKKRSTRKRGGQQGHPGKYRELEEPGRVDRLVERFPKRCRRCRAALHGTDPEPQRHQQWDLPPIRPELTVYRLHRLRCEHCGVSTRAALPRTVAPSAFGPRVHALCAMLSGGYRLSHRQICILFEELFGLKMGLGSVAAIQRRVSQALTEAWKALHKHTREQASLHIDETRFDRPERVGYLWVLTNAKVAFFDHCFSHAEQVARSMLGNEYSGIVHSDRYAVYDYLSDYLRQLCWAHLIRDFRRMANREGLSATVGEGLLEEAHKMFEQWHRLKTRQIARSSFRVYLSSIRVRIRRWLQMGTWCGHSRTQNTCRKILAHETALYTFGRIEGMEPTNNHAERMLRHGVLWRRLSHFVQSRGGSEFVERILSAVQTLRLQRRDLWSWLTQSFSAFLHRRLSPTLLPQPG